MKYLLIRLSFLLLTSCALQKTEGWVATGSTRDFVENHYFSDTSKDYIYKSKIEVYGHNFGGILIIKKTGIQEHRVVFTTEFGNKLFDFLYKGESFTKIFIIDELNKKMIVKTLQRDFKILISEKSKVLEQYTFQDKDIFKTSDEKRTNFYFINKKTHTLDKIVNTTNSSEKVEILFTNNNVQIANNILFNHKNIRLTIELEKFK